jgi:hypothetical protein
VSTSFAFAHRSTTAAAEAQQQHPVINRTDLVAQLRASPFTPHQHYYYYYSFVVDVFCTTTTTTFIILLSPNVHLIFIIFKKKKRLEV